MGMGRVRWILNQRRMEARFRAVPDRCKIKFPNPRQEVRFMSGGQRRSVAIARRVCFNMPIIVPGGPSAALGVEETGKVHAMIREMRGRGVAVLSIGHNLENVSDRCGRIILPSTGRLVGSKRIGETTRDEMPRMMVCGASNERFHF